MAGHKFAGFAFKKIVPTLWLVAASPRIAQRPSITVSRTALVAVAVAGVVLLSLRFVHPLPELLIVAFAPALVALGFANGSRSQFQQNARTSALVTGLTGATWLIISAGRDERLVAVLIGSLVPLVLMTALAWFGAFVINRIQLRRDAWRLP